jgi:uncharacterized membrane protein
METPLTFESRHKWALSLGTFLFIIIIGLFLFWTPTLEILAAIIILMIVATFLMHSGLIEMENAETAARRQFEEQTITEIIKQEMLLIDKEIKEIEYDKLIDKFNKENPTHKKEKKQFRGIDAIARQALDCDYYEKTYGSKK